LCVALLISQLKPLENEHNTMSFSEDNLKGALFSR